MGKHNKAERIRKHNEWLNEFDYFSDDNRKAAMVYFKQHPLQYIHIPEKPRKKNQNRHNTL